MDCLKYYSVKTCSKCALKEREKKEKKKKSFNHLSIKPQLYPTVTLILATRHTKESLYGQRAVLSCQRYFCKEYCSDINQRKKFRKHNNTQGHFLAVHKYKLQLICYNNISYDITSFKVENNQSMYIPWTFNNKFFVTVPKDIFFSCFKIIQTWTLKENGMLTV